MKKSMILLFMLFAFFFYFILDIIIIIIILPFVYLFYAIWYLRHYIDLIAKIRRYSIFLFLLIPSGIVCYYYCKFVNIIAVAFFIGFMCEIICHLLGYCVGYGYEGNGGANDAETPENALNTTGSLFKDFYNCLPCDFFLMLICTYFPMLLLNKIIPKY